MWTDYKLDQFVNGTPIIKFSPQRDAIFQILKAEIAPGLCGQGGLRNYAVLQGLWKEGREIVTDSETHAWIIGVQACLGEWILKHTDNLSKTLQNLSLTAGQQVAKLTCRTLEQIRTTESFDLF